MRGIGFSKRVQVSLSLHPRNPVFPRFVGNTGSFYDNLSQRVIVA